MATKTGTSAGSSGVTIPTRKVVVNDPSELPLDYGTTPGGTMFSTTPGGTRIVYDRKFLLDLRNSPLSKTPPRNLPYIPGVTTLPPSKEKEAVKKCLSPPPASYEKPEYSDEQFPMEIESK